MRHAVFLAGQKDYDDKAFSGGSWLVQRNRCSFRGSIDWSAVSSTEAIILSYYRPLTVLEFVNPYQYFSVVEAPGNWSVYFYLRLYLIRVS